MREKIIWILVLAVAAGEGASAGEIYRCVAANGEVSYTNVSCPAASDVQHVASYQPEPDTPPPSADEVAVGAAEASARDARAAAELAQSAAIQAQAYRQAQNDEPPRAQPLQVDNYAPGWAPLYYPAAAGGRDRHRRGSLDQVRRWDVGQVPGLPNRTTPIRRGNVLYPGKP